MRFFEREYSLGQVTLVAVLANLLLYHAPFLNYAVSHLDFENSSAYITLFCALIALVGVNAFLFSLFAAVTPKFFKFFLIVSALGNSIAFYFVQTYNVILDRSMMGNVFNTRYSEASAYYDPKIFVYLVLFGIVPALVIYKIKIKQTKRRWLLAGGSVALLVSALILYLNSFTWLWLDKNAKFLGGLSMPWSYSINAVRYELKKRRKSSKQKLLPDGKFTDEKKTVVLLVIGESARADHFSLYGYAKPTNPELQKEDILALKNTFSTATYTTASVASILAYDGSTSSDYEPLTNYLHRMGAYVEWRTKNWGEPAQKVDRFYQAGELKKDCKGEECDYDASLLVHLKRAILDAKSNKILIVLHTAGSHGPTYYQKYPPNFERFQPVCKTVDLKQCSKEELLNAYDNTILYTDHFLSQAIKKLKKLHIPAIMLYISDHGESLGEYNLYLHGTPYAIAPDYQKRVPFLIWESREFLKERGWKKPYVKKQEKYGQYNIFHTVLDALSFKSPVYKKEWDLLR